MTAVRRLDRNTFDVFTGTGWDNHTRIRVGRSSTYRLSGVQMPNQQFKATTELLAATMPITYAQEQEQTLENCHAI